MTLQQAQTWYLEETVATASPAKLLTLLYDRMARDLGQARTAFLAGRDAEAQERLAHAREILVELLTTLEPNVWDGAADLSRLYAWMVSELIAAGVKRDPARISGVHQFVLELGQAWHGAAEVVESRAVVPA